MCKNFLELYNRTNSDMFLIGEFHGTKEMPQIFINILKEALTLNKKVNVFLEFPSDMQGLLNNYLEDNVSYKEFLKTKFYTEFYDGRQSKALFSIINFSKNNKDKISCFFVDINERERWDKSCKRDVILKNNILKFFDKNKINFFYAGNMHTISNKLYNDYRWKFFDEEKYLPCGFLLKERLVNVISINLAPINGKMLILDVNELNGKILPRVRYCKFNNSKDNRHLSFIFHKDSVYDYEYKIKRVSASYKLR